VKSLAIIWAQYGPYHFARVSALRKWAGSTKVHALELASRTSDYQWSRAAADGVITLFPGEVTEQLPFREVFRRVRRAFVDLEVEVCLLPGYSPKQSLGALLAAKSLGIRTVMMCESHAGTASARGAAGWVKRRLVNMFDAALVGGAPHAQFFSSLGLPGRMIFTGYDAVDNDYFARRAEDARRHSAEARRKFRLPDHYFLSLGRFVRKKNLSGLIRAYRKFLEITKDRQTHLVMVGSGEEEPRLRLLCEELGLPIYDKTKSDVEGSSPGVHFYGFRQIEENPVFYALADAFILPSLWEEWGLVVNEAMACGLPVAVARNAGCAEDLLPADPQRRPTQDLAGIRKNGYLFDPNSPDSLARALESLASDPDMRQAMGMASRIIVNRFSCDVFAQNALTAASVACGEAAPPPRHFPARQPLGVFASPVS
jgi:1,2-diacylglycerol 3-alpha-glucosyltransferase